MSLDLVFFWLHLGIAGAILMVVMLLAAEVGFRLGRRARKNTDDPSRSQFTTVEGAGLAVVGLLLAFTFSMSASRFETRRRIVVDEANAIGTAYLRARLLPQRERQEAETLLRRYVDVWLELRESGRVQARFDAAAKELHKVQEQLWALAGGVAGRNPNAITLSLLLQSLNEVFDRHSELMASVANRVPGVTLLLLVLGTFISMGQVGYGCGLAGRRGFVAILMLSFLLTAIIVVILDLDRPGRGLVQLDPHIMVNLRASLNAPAP